MQLRYTERFGRSYDKAPARIQKAFDKQVALLIANLRHPSLKVKKYDEARGIWQARVNGGWRFYFTIEGNIYNLIDIMPHPK